MAAILDSSYFDFLYILSLIISVASGYLFARYRYFNKQRRWKNSGVENAIIGFYGLLLSFTMVQAGVSNKDRIGLVHQEADALASVYRESFFLTDSARMEMQQAVTHIIELNIKAGDANAEELKSIYATTNDTYDDAWNLVRVLAGKNAGPPKTMDGIEDALNHAIVINYRMQYSHHERTPLRIMVLLITGSWLVGILIGFTNGFNEEHHFLVPVIFIMLTGLTLLAIRDMDNPSSGVIRPSYENYRDLLKDIRSETMSGKLP